MKFEKEAIKSKQVFWGLMLALLILAGFHFSATDLEAVGIIHIGTGSPNAIYYPYGVGVAEIWSKRVPEIRAVAEATGASKDNIALINAAKSHCGAVRGDLAYQAYRGTGRFRGRRQKIRAMFVMYPDVYHVVTVRAAGIKSLDDLLGRTVSVGAKGSGTELMSGLILKKGLDIGYTGFDMRRLSFTESARALQEKRIDAGVWAVASPTASLMRLSVLTDVKFISFNREEMDQITNRLPFYSQHTLTSGVYRGQNQPVVTPAVWNLFVCHTDLDTDLVYKMVKATYAGYKHLVRMSPFAKETTPKNTLRYSAIALHPGAIRYFKERGLVIPSRLKKP